MGYKIEWANWKTALGKLPVIARERLPATSSLVENMTAAQEDTSF